MVVSMPQGGHAKRWATATHGKEIIGALEGRLARTSIHCVGGRGSGLNRPASLAADTGGYGAGKSP